MAKCEKKYENITYILELSEEEAATLMAITKRIGGDPFNSPRGHISHIARAFRVSGVSDTSPEYELMSDDSEIRFNNYSSDSSRKPR